MTKISEKRYKKIVFGDFNAFIDMTKQYLIPEKTKQYLIPEKDDILIYDYPSSIKKFQENNEDIALVDSVLEKTGIDDSNFIRPSPIISASVDDTDLKNVLYFFNILPNNIDYINNTDYKISKLLDHCYNIYYPYNYNNFEIPQMITDIINVRKNNLITYLKENYIIYTINNTLKKIKDIIENSKNVRFIGYSELINDLFNRYEWLDYHNNSFKEFM